MGVNSKPGLPKVGKFNYLKAQVTGEAEHAITGFPITSRNYARAIATLKERFGHPHKVANAHMTALLDLPHPTSHQPSLRSFYDTLETNIRALEAPAKSQDTFADLLVPVSVTTYILRFVYNLWNPSDHQSGPPTVMELTAAEKA